MADPIIDEKFLNSRIVKTFRHLTLTDLPDAPVHALRGLSEGDGELLYKSFYVKTIRDLADLKYIMWAQEIVALGKVPQSKIDMHAFQDKLIKKYEATPIKKLIQSPITVLQGVSAADTKRMREAFNVKTVNDLARLKFARWSQEICGAAYESMSAPIAQPTALAPDASDRNAGQVDETRGQFWLRTLLLILLVAAILFAIYWFFRHCNEKQGPAGSEQQGVEKQAVIEAPDEPTGPEQGAGETSAGPAQQAEVSEGGDVFVSPAAGGELKSGASYPIQRGDTLYDLSRRAYGTQRQWRKIYEANRNLIADPDLLVTGRILKIP